MPKISDLTVADLRGACAQMKEHLRGPLGFEKADVSADISSDRVQMTIRAHGKGVPKGSAGFEAPYWITLWDTLDSDWGALQDKAWAEIAKHARPEVREIRAVMGALGSAIEILDQSRSEFAADLAAGIKRARDDAGARLIEYQQAAE